MSLEEIIINYTDTPQITETFIKIKNRFQKSGLHIENISYALVSVMLEVNKIKNLSITERKQLTISILELFVEEICPGEDTMLETVLKQMIPSLFDQFQDMKRPLKCWCY